MKLKIEWPIDVNGRAIAVPKAMADKTTTIGAGGFALQSGSRVLIENKKRSSVRTLPINQFVCKTCGEILKNNAKKRKSKNELTIPSSVPIRAISLISYARGLFNSDSSTLSAATVIIGKSVRRLMSRSCSGRSGKKFMKSDATATV